jgi:pimeloyl-ACP methyl ester carboxylesterase
VERLRKYGSPPFKIAVIHGGPGAPGEMGPVARELASDWSILEPFQTAGTVKEQVEELKDVLEEEGRPPVSLIGFSWGAWLSLIFAATHPAYVKKLILVGSGPFEAKYAARIMETRMDRLSRKEKAEVLSLMDSLIDPTIEDRDRLMGRFGALISGADSHDPLPHGDEVVNCQYDIYQSVWEDAKRLRQSGELLDLAGKIECPVAAIHGDYDPHPSEGVRVPLAAILSDFRFIQLAKCGHCPWVERSAKDEFYRYLREELR